MKNIRHDINMTIRFVSLHVTAFLFLGAVAAAIYLKQTPLEVWHDFILILSSPSPLVTDYFRLGGLSAAFLNAGICGLICSLMMQLKWVIYRPSVWAGFFLVVAHCFYGLNVMNIWIPMLGFLVFCKLNHLKFRDNLDGAMFITSFSPFFSEIMFRYPFKINFFVTIFDIQIRIIPVVVCILLAIFICLTLPPLLPGTSKLHRGFNLYNGGLATGLLGLFIYSFMFKTLGITSEGPVAYENPIYEAHGNSYFIFCTVFFVVLALSFVVAAMILNDGAFKNYGELLKDSGYKANFLRDYGLGATVLNLAVYMLFMLAYFDLVIYFTDGAGFTGATCGIILAAMSFAASGQHPKNVFPILVGYILLSVLVHCECFLVGRDIPWTLSTQGYMNGIAFATGLCPFAGKYGWKIGVLAGFISAVICTSTTVMHGGFVLYNGGLQAGITALILLPIIDTYVTREENWGKVENVPRD